MGCQKDIGIPAVWVLLCIAVLKRFFERKRAVRFRLGLLCDTIAHAPSGMVIVQYDFRIRNRLSFHVNNPAGNDLRIVLPAESGKSDT